MTILADYLSVWDIGFRWAGYDPDKLHIRIPLAVRDNFRTLINEIHHCRLECESLFTVKYHGDDPEEAKFYIRYWLDSVEDCSSGRRYDRQLLRWAGIDRQNLQEWCERHKVPLPEFWFPPGWGIEYEWPDDTPAELIEPQPSESVEEKKTRIDNRHRCQMACQQIALHLWSKNPKLTNKEIAIEKEVQELGGGNGYELETVQEWIAKVDPRDPAKKRGRKRKNNPGSGNPDDSQPTDK
jgi:hypothetical protein